MTTIRAANPSLSYPCADWIGSIGIPDHVTPTPLVAVAPGGRRFPAFVAQRMAFVRPVLEPGQKLDLELRPPGPNDPRIAAFSIDPWVADEPLKLVPQFFAKINGVVTAAYPITSVVTRMEWDPVMRRSEAMVRWPGCPLTFQFRLTVFTEQSVCEWELAPVYGTTRTGDPVYGDIRGITMRIGEFPVVDDRTPNGLHYPVWNDALGTYEVELANPSVNWLRSRMLPVRGALLCMPPIDRIESAAQSPKALAMRYRREARPIAVVPSILAKTPFGLAPTIAPELLAQEAAGVRFLLHRRLNTPGSPDDQPLFTQPSWSATTGRQPDWGAIHQLAGLILDDPSLIHYLRRDVDADMRRPVHFREHVTGLPVQATAHPNTVTYCGVPHPQLCTDLLGNQHPMPFDTLFTASDDEHRAGLLARFLALTQRDPTLLEHIQDCHQMDLLGYWRKRQPNPGGGIGAPRGWGRPLMIWCWDYCCGFPRAEELIRDAVERMYLGASMMARDATRDVQVLEERIVKYGWSADSRPIEGWWPWMEAEAIRALRAADLLFGLPEARELILRSARTVVRHAFYVWEGRWRCTYAVRSTPDGSALPASSYWPAEGQNPDVFTYDTAWVETIPAVDILLSMEPNGPDAPRCREIIAAFGPPRTLLEAAQRAVR
jgi:hypothetical protein